MGRWRTRYAGTVGQPALGRSAPGGTHTPGTRKVAQGALRQWGLLKTGYDYLQRLPNRRMAEPDEIARMVLVLCSELASYMQGAVVSVDGGFLSA